MGVFIKYLAVGSLFGYGARLVPEGKHDVIRMLLTYGAVNLISLSGLFYMRWCRWLIGKDKTTGRIPFWSFVLFWPFHLTNVVYIHIVRVIRQSYATSADQVLPNLWIGGWWADQVPGVKRWHGIVDLTNEFPERGEFDTYLNLPTWDGNPISQVELSTGAEFIAQSIKEGPTLCHCGFGVGRSTTLVCAALVVCEAAPDIDTAFKMIKAKRSIVRLNKGMREALRQWEETYKKSQ